ncbi:MAG: hypothetical protein OEW19_20665, partial [Acidobacteriota bacterium]|nr:hypothetical protein [Acidobacteriota bacterium]
MTRTMILLTTLGALTLVPPAAAMAQSLGTFRWQLQPYCNIVTVTVTQVGGVYRLEGTDDRCGGGVDLASALGVAFLNPGGSIGIGLSIVTTPAGAPVHVAADIALGTLSGTWRDSAGGVGAFVFSPGAGTGGSPRPQPPPGVPPSLNFVPGGGIVALPDGDGPIPASGAGVRMMWYPGKAAFRAGEVRNDAWDEANVGTSSMAFGRSTRASGDRSTAMGFSTSALGDQSTAMGRDTTASGEMSTAMGFGTIASQLSSTAMGSQTTASGVASTAMGSHSEARGDHSVAMGKDS